MSVVMIDAPPMRPPGAFWDRAVSFVRWTIVAIACLGCAVPILALAVWSFSASWGTGSPLPQRWGPGAWSYLASAGAAMAAPLLNTVVVAIAATLGSLLLGVPAAVALDRSSPGVRRLIARFLPVAALAPPLAIAFAAQPAFLRWAIGDTLVAVVFVHLVIALPWVMLVVGRASGRHGGDFEALARSLGARPVGVLLHVTVPALLPSIAGAAAVAFLLSWSQYVTTLVLGGAAVPTLATALAAFARSGDFAIAAALALVLMLPGIVLTALAVRALSSGRDIRRGAGP